MAAKGISNRAVRVAPQVEEPIATPLAEAGTVTVRAVGHIGENGTNYKPGDTFTVTTKRRAALGRQVEDVKE